ncbi:MAG TPA: hypothetical protein VNI20_09265 [Fimbriimonadaceae bacterium]|nr:hypothetical protein [Fimbriimonadaceae bacterium]
MMLAPSDFVANSDDMIMALVLGGIVLMTPVIAIVTYHQRKMAEIVHKAKSGDGLQTVIAELVKLRQEVKSLREQTNANTIALDDVRSRAGLESKEQPPSIEERMMQ